MKTVSREKLKRKIDRGEEFLLLEVLGEASYNRAHLPAAVRCRDLDQVSDLAPDKATEISAYCSNFD